MGGLVLDVRELLVRHKLYGAAEKVVAAVAEHHRLLCYLSPSEALLAVDYSVS